SATVWWPEWPEWPEWPVRLDVGAASTVVTAEWFPARCVRIFRSDAGPDRGASGADGPVDRLAQEVGMAVVPGVLLDHVHHHQPQRDVLAPAGLVSGHVERRGLALDPPGDLDLGRPGI